MDDSGNRSPSAIVNVGGRPGDGSSGGKPATVILEQLQGRARKIEGKTSVPFAPFCPIVADNLQYSSSLVPHFAASSDELRIERTSNIEIGGGDIYD